MVFLSVIIVTKNEERNISRCIKSVLSYTRNIEYVEIILVDSCSTDSTVEIAKQYPIDIIQLGKDWPHSPSAGRFTGVNNTSGKYVLIIDGDMELLDGWIELALEFMEDNPNTASVRGKHYDVYYQSDGSYTRPELRKVSKFGTAKKIEYVFGSSIFRKSALMEAGNFQPFLRAEEEAEISCRLTKKGYDLFFLPYDSINHYSIPSATLKETMRRTKNNLHAGIGDMVTWALQKGYYSLIWKRCKVVICFAVMIFFCLIGVSYSIFVKDCDRALVLASIPSLFILTMSFKKRSINQAVVGTIDKTIISFYIMSSIFKRINNISDYPKNITWIKKLEPPRV